MDVTPHLGKEGGGGDVLTRIRFLSPSSLFLVGGGRLSALNVGCVNRRRQHKGPPFFPLLFLLSPDQIAIYTTCENTHTHLTLHNFPPFLLLSLTKTFFSSSLSPPFRSPTLRMLSQPTTAQGRRRRRRRRPP